MRIYGVYGMNCQNDLSQKMFQAIFAHYHIEDFFYQVFDVAPRAVTGAIQSLTKADFAGVNVLWPYQEYVTELVDECSELVNKAFAANVIIADGGYLSAHNTNGIGMMRAIRETAKVDVVDKQVLLLGAGAAARTMAVVLAEAGVKKILLANRTKERALQNAADLASKLDCEITGCGWDDPCLGDYLAASDIVANCTFLGNMEHLTEMPVPELLSGLHARQLVIDVTCKPAETPFLQKAKTQGAQTLPGYFITAYQGAESYKMWTLDEAPLDVIIETLEKEVCVK